MSNDSKHDISIEMIEPFSTGAMVQFAHSLCNALGSRCDKVSVISGSGFELSHLPRSYQLRESFNIPRPDLSRNSNDLKVTRWNRATTRIIVLLQFIWQYYRVTNQIIKRQPDYIIVGTVFRYPLMSFFIRRMHRRGIRCVQFCHEFQMRERSRKVSHIVTHNLNRGVYQNFHTIFFLAEKQREAFTQTNESVDTSRMFVVNNGNFDFFDEIKSSQSARDVLKVYNVEHARRNVLFFGRVREDKGIEDLLDAFAQMIGKETNDLQDTRLLILGDTPANLLTEIQQQIQTLGIEHRVSLFPGYVKNEHVAHVFSVADVALFPYRSGTQSGPLQIAMTLKVPVIVSDAGGLSEVVRHGKTGLVVKSNSPGEICDAMTRILRDPQLAKSCAEGALELSQSLYSWDYLANQVLEALQRPASQTDSLNQVIETDQ